MLVVIVTVGYNGITKQAKETSLKSDLKQAYAQLNLDKAKNNIFPSNANNLKSSPENTFSYTGDGDSFCLVASNPSLKNSYVVTEEGNIMAGSCPIVMQEFSQLQCNEMKLFNGTNEDVLVNGTDRRGGIPVVYQIGKLADNNCWMLNNLKLGSTGGAITLTDEYTNLNTKTSYVLPKLTMTNSSYPAAIYGPIPGDTGAGKTNYGYLYNWSAATAGESRESFPAGRDTAPNSICPKNWRLPTGGEDGDFSKLNIVFGGTNESAYSGEANIAKWQFTGPFKGVYSGFWS